MAGSTADQSALEASTSRLSIWRERGKAVCSANSPPLNRSRCLRKIGENPPAAEDLVTRLGDVFRYSLTSARHDHVRFADEMEFVRNCLAIEHARFGERLRLEEAIAPGLDEIPVPPLLLQPLVENAVRYAVSTREEGGRVRIEASREGDRLRVTIADDGPGFTPGVAPSGHGVGLESVRERLRFAGGVHALEIDSRPGQGTRVTVTLPIAAP